MVSWTTRYEESCLLKLVPTLRPGGGGRKSRCEGKVWLWVPGLSRLIELSRIPRKRQLNVSWRALSDTPGSCKTRLEAGSSWGLGGHRLVGSLLPPAGLCRWGGWEKWFFLPSLLLHPVLQSPIATAACRLQRDWFTDEGLQARSHTEVAERTKLCVRGCVCVCVCRKLSYSGNYQAKSSRQTIVSCLDNLCHQINTRMGCVQLKVIHFLKSGVSSFGVSVTGDGLAHKSFRQQYLWIYQSLL